MIRKALHTAKLQSGHIAFQSGQFRHQQGKILGRIEQLLIDHGLGIVIGNHIAHDDLTRAGSWGDGRCVIDQVAHLLETPAQFTILEADLLGCRGHIHGHGSRFGHPRHRCADEAAVPVHAIGGDLPHNQKTGLGIDDPVHAGQGQPGGIIRGLEDRHAGVQHICIRGEVEGLAAIADGAIVGGRHVDDLRVGVQSVKDEGAIRRHRGGEVGDWLKAHEGVQFDLDPGHIRAVGRTLDHVPLKDCVPGAEGGFPGGGIVEGANIFQHIALLLFAPRPALFWVGRLPTGHPVRLADGHGIGRVGQVEQIRLGLWTIPRATGTMTGGALLIIENLTVDQIQLIGMQLPGKIDGVPNLGVGHRILPRGHQLFQPPKLGGIEPLRRGDFPGRGWVCEDGGGIRQLGSRGTIPVAGDSMAGRAVFREERLSAQGQGAAGGWVDLG